MKIIEQSSTHQILIGADALSLFQHFNVNSMHGLDVESCQARILQGGTYIEGLGNYQPTADNRYDYERWFVFFNLQAFRNDYRDVSLVMHELAHIGFLLHEWDVNQEESIITFAEDQTNRLYPIIKQYVSKYQREGT